MKSMEWHGETIGQMAGAPRSKEYNAWRGMLARCDDPRQRSYKTHGARGITVCVRWRRSFGAFLSDMGRSPSRRHQLDRRDNDGNYTPKNCRWATPAMQARNRRTSKLTWKEVVAIRSRLASGDNRLTIIGECYGVTAALIYRIKNRLCWKEAENA